MDDIAQQADIMPSVLSFLGVDASYIAFGNDLFDSTAGRFAINRLDGTWQLLKAGWSMQYDGKDIVSFKPMELYHGKTEHRPDEQNEILDFLKAYIQQYNNRLLNNELVIREDDE